MIAWLWCGGNILVLCLVIFGIKRNIKFLLLPALILSLLNVVLGALSGIINFVFLNWFG